MLKYLYKNITFYKNIFCQSSNGEISKFIFFFNLKNYVNIIFLKKNFINQKIKKNFL